VFQRPAASNPWRSRGLEWQVPTPVPADKFVSLIETAANPVG